MRCADCKHWEGPDESQSYGNRDFGLGECNRAKMFWDATEWSGEEGNYDRIELDPSSLMYVQDGSDYSAVLLTKPNFFCAHFEGKEP